MSETKKVLHDKKDVLEVFGQDFEEFCTIEFVDSLCVLRPKQFFGKEVWGDINKKVKAIGGEWVSAGKDSHWDVPQTPKKAAPEKVASHEFDEAIAKIRNACDLLESLKK